MITDSSISGITLNQDTNDGVYVCYVENFSDDLKNKIRELLSNIWHGMASAKENEDIYSYKYTLKDFLDRYNSQSANTKKGIIGELLAHILIPKCDSNLEVISIMKNKEERSIKKGFDIVYSNNELENIWYCEVKSGGDEDTSTADDKNKERLTTAKNGIKEMFDSNRTTIWDSVLNDVHLTVFNSDRQLDIKQLLKADHPNITNRNMDRNVILTSVVYKTLNPKISSDKVNTFKSNVDGENIFANLIVFSIQKETYTKIEDFLTQEANESIDG